MSDEAKYGLVMPFVFCESQGGPYQDEAFVAGWELGALDARLQFALVLTIEATVRTASLRQVDLIAMRHGRRMLHAGETESEWTTVCLVSP